MIQQLKLLFVIYFTMAISINYISTARHPNTRHGRVRNLNLKNLCQKGTYYSAAKSNCIACLCDPIGSKNVTCDASSGQCFCKMGYHGEKCTSCSIGYYRDIFKKTCIPCNCNKDGSKSIKCTPTGQYQCKQNIGGKKCNRCLDLKLNFRKECTENCPDMYDVLGSEFKRFDKKLQEVQMVLNSIGMEKSRMGDLTSKINELRQEAMKELIDWGDQDDVLKLFEMVNDLRNQIRSYTRRAGDLNELQRITKQILEELTKMDSIIKSFRDTCVESCKKAVSYNEDRNKFLRKLNEIRTSYNDASSRIALLENQADTSKNKAQITARRSNQIHEKVKNLMVLENAGDGVLLPLETDRINRILKQLNEMREDLKKVQELYGDTRKLQADYAFLTVEVIHDYLEKCTINVGNHTKITLQNLQSYENRLKNISVPLQTFQSNITDILHLIDNNLDKLEEFKVLAKKFISDDDKTKEILKEIFKLIDEINVTVVEGTNLLTDTKKDLAREEANFDKAWAETEKKTKQAIKEMQEKNDILERDVVNIEIDISKVEKDVETLQAFVEHLQMIRLLSEELAQLKVIKEELDKVDNPTLCPVSIV